MSGIGRGGRGAALNEALSVPVRQPGTGAPDAAATSPQPSAKPTPTVGIGRGNLLQQMMLQRQQLQQQQTEQASIQPSSQHIPVLPPAQPAPLQSPAVVMQQLPVNVPLQPPGPVQPPVQQIFGQPSVNGQPRPSLGRGAMLGMVAAMNAATKPQSIGRGSPPTSSDISPKSAGGSPPTSGEISPKSASGSPPTPSEISHKSAGGSPPTSSDESSKSAGGNVPSGTKSSSSAEVSPGAQYSPAITPPLLQQSAARHVGDELHVTEVGAGDGRRRDTRLENILSHMHMGDAIVRTGSAGEPMRVTCNYIRVKSNLEGVFQYHVGYDPIVESMGLRRRLLMQHSNIIGDTVAFDGAILFLPRKLPSPELIVKSTRDTDNNNEVTLIIKLVKVLPPAACIQMYNILFRKVMKILQLVQVGRNYYDPYHAESVTQHKDGKERKMMEVWPGYITAIEEQEGGLMLLADVSHRVLHTHTVLDDIKEMLYNRNNNSDPQGNVTRALVGTVVLTRYNNKTYKVDDIMWDKSPKDTFPRSRGGGEISFMDYYREAYGKTIEDAGQPLLISRPKIRDKSGKKVESLICLIPELCYTTGLTDEVRKNFTVMKALAEHTRVTPNQRQLSVRKFINNVNSNPGARAELAKWGLELEADSLRIDARLMPSEKIRFNNWTADAGPEADWGREIGKRRVITAINLHNWLLVFFERNRENVKAFVDTLMQVSGPMGIEVQQPHIESLKSDRTDAYIAAIKNQLNKDTQMVVAVFPTARDDRYSAVKKLCCVEFPVPSQMINSNTIKPCPKLRSVSQKVLLQMNCKMGGELWAVDIPTNNLMVVGIDVYHDGATRTKRSVGAIVCSMNADCTRYYSRVAYQLPGQELMDSLKVLFIDALKMYNKTMGRLPNRIVVFRDGVGDGQLKFVQDHEVAQLRDVFRHFEIPDYNPKLTVVIVCKRINTRIFAMQNQRELTNPPPGTVVDNTITRKHWFDFFIVSQHVRQGTVSPTHYIVVHDESEWKVDIIQKLTYKMTHLYYNWPGTIRVPAPCQNAHKLASLVGQHLHKEPDARLSDRLYYM